MDILITLDYELFLGGVTGSLRKCIIDPTERILKIAERREAKLTFFVDSGYLLRLREIGRSQRKLDGDYRSVIQNLNEISRRGHDIQLHIHPQWEDSNHEGTKWITESKRYRLHSFENDEITRIVDCYKRELERYVNDEIVAYRAGGYCLQPFEKISDALRSNGLCVDSSVYRNGVNHSDTHYYDFRGGPDKTFWKFDDDPLREDESGFFLELPISSFRSWPCFFWRLLVVKLLASKRHRALGDGKAITPARLNIVKSLISRIDSTVSLDGYKASILNRVFWTHKRKYKKNKDCFIVIGHPKAMTPFSFVKFEEFIKNNMNENRFMSLREKLADMEKVRDRSFRDNSEPPKEG